MKIKVFAAALCAASAAIGFAAPASAAVTVYTSEAAFDAAISGMTVSKPINNEPYGTGASSDQIGPVTVTARRS